jgi:hypothetical protein
VTGRDKNSWPHEDRSCGVERGGDIHSGGISRDGQTIPTAYFYLDDSIRKKFSEIAWVPTAPPDNTTNSPVVSLAAFSVSELKTTRLAARGSEDVLSWMVNVLDAIAMNHDQIC